MFPFTAPLNNKLRYNQGSYLGLISLPSPCKASRTPRVYDGCHATGNSAGWLAELREWCESHILLDNRQCPSLALKGWDDEQGEGTCKDLRLVRWSRRVWYTGAVCSERCREGIPLVSMGEIGTRRDIMGETGTRRVTMGQIGTSWDRLGHGWSQWDRLGQGGTPWKRLGLHRAIFQS